MPFSKSYRFFDNVILPVFNYAQNDRENFLLIKFLEAVLKEEIEYVFEHEAVPDRKIKNAVIVAI